MTALEDLPEPRRDLAARSLQFCDRFWNESRGLIKAPPGSGFGNVHLVQGAAWYAYGLLLRGDHKRAERCLHALLQLQIIDPGAPWHGTFARFAESPRVDESSIIWRDWDPNWRQFVGTGLALIVRDFGPVVDVDEALGLCIEGEPDDRVPASYSNIALLKAWLETEVGDRAKGELLAREVTDLFFVRGAFDEYNSPTYYGIDLFALALWTERSSSPVLRKLGSRIEESLWRDIARWYHGDLRNLCGPYSRAYGLDMSRYVGGLGFWIANQCGKDQAPLPSFSEDVPHGHDLLLAPVSAVLGSRLPAGVDFPAPLSERLNRQELGDGRIATGWLADGVMIGGETNPGPPVSDPAQAHPATVHWCCPDESVGHITVRSHGAVSAIASGGRLDVQWPRPSPDLLSDVQIVVRSPETGPRALEGPHWALPGLRVAVDYQGLGRRVVEPIADGRLQVTFERLGDARLSLRVEPTG